MKRRIAVCALFASLVLAVPAWADIYSFSRITSNSSLVLSQLAVDVTDLGSGKVGFKFTNNVGVGSSVTGIYFDNAGGVLGSISGMTESSGVDFSIGGSPPSLPGGTNIGFSSDFVATANPPPTSNGINHSNEYLSIAFNLSSGKTFTSTLAALNDSSMRIGLHVQAIAGQSDSYVSLPKVGRPQPVPSPSAALLGVVGLAVLAVRRPRLARVAV